MARAPEGATLALRVRVDAQPPPVLARWLGALPGIGATHTFAALRTLVTAAWPPAVDLLRAGEPLVEPGDRRG